MSTKKRSKGKVVNTSVQSALAGQTLNKGGASRIALDLTYYREHYPDLANLDEKALEKHWHEFGFYEGRYASASHAAGDATLVSEAVSKPDTAPPSLVEKMPNVDLDFYLTLYPDLKPNGVTSQAIADLHYERYGKSEGRVPSLTHWLKQHELPESLVPYGFNLSSIVGRSAKRGIEIEPHRILETMLGQNVAPVELAETSEKTQAMFIKLGKHYLSAQKVSQGRHLLEAALSFGPSAEALEHLGNTYINEGHINIALRYYEAAASFPNPPKWIAWNRAVCLTRLNRVHEALVVLAKGIQTNPNFRQQYDELDRLAEQQWEDFHAEMLTWVDSQDRARLIEEAKYFAKRIYEAYLPVFGKSEPCKSERVRLDAAEGFSKLPPLGSLNCDRVLIVGDFHIAQCVRYRINQKVEQLTAQGKQVKAIDWLDLNKFSSDLALHDVVIFYRVPAVPKVIKAIAQVNATGKLSIYEIDDLLFVPEYPPAIETYGGYVSLETYRGLTRGMALFGAAARLCRIGIASTEPLRKELEELVQEKECWLHRNGLDSLNKLHMVDKTKKRTIDIFYGSGTQAHNSDFIEQALPAIEKILGEFPQARLVVVGYLRLPKDFINKYESQYSQLPAVKSVQGYWSLLEQADINIAVLHDDKVNSSKSELKWFEAACFAIPSILSSTANYRDVVKDGEDAFLATTTAEWYSALKKLVSDQGLRLQMGKAAMRRAEKDYSIDALGRLLEQRLISYKNSQAGVKPKLALVNVFFPPQSIGGATRVVVDNFQSLRKHYKENLDVCVFTADVECRTPHEMTVYDYQGCRVYRATTLWRENMDWHPHDPKMYDLFKEFLELEKPDVIHFHCVQRLTSSIVEAAKDLGVPYVITAHDAWWISDFQFLVDHKSKVYPLGHPDPYQILDLPAGIDLGTSIERRRDLKDLLKGASDVFTVSNAFADIYRANGITDIKVIPNGISEEINWREKETSAHRKVVCGHIGGMSEHKGYYLLKEAVLKLQPLNLEFLVVDHSKEEGYESHSYWGKVPVTFIGRVQQEGIVDLYGKIDVLFAPSTWPESFGLVTREAAACGCWIVASKLGGIGEDVIENENGHVIDPSQEALEAIMARIDKSYKHYKTSSNTLTIKTATAQLFELERQYRSIIDKGMGDVVLPS